MQEHLTIPRKFNLNHSARLQLKGFVEEYDGEIKRFKGVSAGRLKRVWLWLSRRLKLQRAESQTTGARTLGRQGNRQ